jgi:hydroxymethylpyrimidine pyrophosphatase-like HAD family hydrolase
LTGRPAGWANCLIQYFPIHTILSENGALGFNKRDGEIRTWRHPDCVPITGEVGRKFVARVAKEFPTAVFSQDNDYRLFDFAVDIAPTREADPTFDFIKLVDFVEREGWQVKESSIHFNIWKGVYDKLGGLGLFLKAEGIDPEDVRVNGVFAGDSPNDEPLFGWFENSYGVAGVQKYLPIIKQHPKHILNGEEGAGFRELVDRLLEADSHA